jgi:TRAP-type C4-dicarboxylate transport system permease large subunit
MFIIANAGLFAFPHHPRRRARGHRAVAAGSVLQSPAVFLLGVNAALFLIGMFIETGAAIIVLAPILAPVAVHFGIDPVHFGTGGGGQPRAGDDHAALRREPVCGLHRGAHFAGPHHPATSCPSSAWCWACLMVITYVPALSLALRDLVWR